VTQETPKPMKQSNNMKIINVELAANTYPVYLGQGLLSEHSLWHRHLATGKTLIVSNDVVAPLYLETLKSSLSGRDLDVHIIPDGEPFKNTETWYGIIDKLVGMQARRDANIIALGGGVVGDITGFAAACYMRGVRFLQAPTTLLAQVDASVGGKTGINHQRGKNLVGAFHQPAAVVIDSATLSTLADREFNAGLAEVVKYGAIRDPLFFAWLEEHASEIIDRDAEAIDNLVYQSVLNKAEIVSEDEKEAGIRALLNFGHSFGHALEAETRYSEFLHGEAIAIGMVTATRLSESRGLCDPGITERVSALLARFGLPLRIPARVSIKGLSEALELDKKAIASGLRLILLSAIGQAVVDNNSSQSEIITVMEQSLNRNRTRTEE
jgi:3-dehydroquinate synthase